MDLETLKYAAKYPFTPSAKKLISELNVDFNTLSEEDIDFSYQALLALMSKKYLTPMDIESSKENYLKKLVMSYPISNIIINLSKNHALKMKYARLRSIQIKRLLDAENEETINTLANEFFTINNNEIAMRDYLNNLPQGEDSRLVYQNLKNGKVKLDQTLKKNLLSEKIYNVIMQTFLPKINYPKSMIYYAEDIKEQQKSPIFTEDLGTINTNAYPPCMKSIIEQLVTGQSVGHMSRFVLVTFLIAIGMPDEEIVKLYSNQENFNRERTLYHVQHARGSASNATKYSAPGCAKMQSFGCCYKNETCRWSHPLKYYKMIKDNLERKNGKNSVSEVKG